MCKVKYRDSCEEPPGQWDTWLARAHEPLTESREVTYTSHWQSLLVWTSSLCWSLPSSVAADSLWHETEFTCLTLNKYFLLEFAKLRCGRQSLKWRGILDLKLGTKYGWMIRRTNQHKLRLNWFLECFRIKHYSSLSKVRRKVIKRDPVSPDTCCTRRVEVPRICKLHFQRKVTKRGIRMEEGVPMQQKRGQAVSRDGEGWADHQTN